MGRRCKRSARADANGSLEPGWARCGSGLTRAAGASLKGVAPPSLRNAGQLLVAVGRDFPAVGELVIVSADGETQHTQIAVGQRDFKIQRIDGLPPRQVTPPKATLERIRREQIAVNAARSKNRKQADFQEGFDWPLKGRITGVYGSQRILIGQPRQPHYGVDVAAPVGTIVLAPADERSHWRRRICISPAAH